MARTSQGFDSLCFHFFSFCSFFVCLKKTWRLFDRWARVQIFSGKVVVGAVNATLAANCSLAANASSCLTVWTSLNRVVQLFHNSRREMSVVDRIQCAGASACLLAVSNQRVRLSRLIRTSLPSYSKQLFITFPFLNVADTSLPSFLQSAEFSLTESPLNQTVSTTQSLSDLAQAQYTFKQCGFDAVCRSIQLVVLEQKVFEVVTSMNHTFAARWVSHLVFSCFFFIFIFLFFFFLKKILLFFCRGFLLCLAL
jgi:hypothetical protein